MQELRIQRSGGVNLMIAVLGLVAFFAYILFAEGDKWHPAAAALIGAFTLIAIAGFIWAESRKVPGLIIGSEGITDNVGKLGFIPWNDVEEIEIIEKKYRALGVKFRDPKKFGVSDSSSASTWRAVMTRGYYPIDIGMLKTTAPEVIETARYFFAQARSTAVQPIATSFIEE